MSNRQCDGGRIGTHADDAAERAGRAKAELRLHLAVAHGARAYGAVPAPLAVTARQVRLAFDRKLVARELVGVLAIAVDLPDLPTGTIKMRRGRRC